MLGEPFFSNPTDYADKLKNRLVALLSSTGAITSRFIYGMSPNIPDYMVKSGTTYKIVSNHLGSPVQVINTSTGAISEQITYDEFGNILSDTSSGFQPFGFAGCLYDTDTKLCHFGGGDIKSAGRDYDAYTGRWTNRDPILFNGGDPNLYNYASTDPVNSADPSGMVDVCTRPLNGLPAEIGPLYHEFLCVPDGHGGTVCGGQAPVYSEDYLSYNCLNQCGLKIVVKIPQSIKTPLNSV